MDFSSYRASFEKKMGVKHTANAHELALFARTQKYVKKLADIPGIEMVAIANSLSMYATHAGSDIDLFIVTKPKMLWFVRVFVTLRFWRLKVWRKGDDIAGNFCLSFFVTTEALDFTKIAIKDDIYLYFWIYFLKPIIDRDGTYEKFLSKNDLVKIDSAQKIENRRYLIATKEPKNADWYRLLSKMLQWIFERKTLRRYEKLGEPEGVIISSEMLKFHDKDKRKEIRDAIVRKNFDK